MDTDDCFHDHLYTLLLYLIFATKSHSPQFHIDDRLRRIILDRSKIIEQDIPEVVRDKLHRLGSEVREEFRKVSHQPISSNVSRFPVTTSAPILQDYAINEGGKQNVAISLPAEALQPSKHTPKVVKKSSKRPPSTRNKCLREDDQPIPFDTLKSWVASPESFLDSAAISIHALSVSGYIQALEKSSQISRIARRFALLQLWISREAWRPLPLDEFNQELGNITKKDLNRWLREGRTLFLLKAHSGAAVLFSKLKSRDDLSILAPKLKVRSEDNTSPSFGGTACDDLELALQSHYALEAKELAFHFNEEELEIPRSHDDDITNANLYRDAATKISLYLKEFHERFFSKRTQRIRGPEASETERPAKKMRLFHHQFSHEQIHSGNQISQYVTENTINATSDGHLDVRGAPADESAPTSGSPEGAGSRPGTSVIPGSDFALISTPALEATVDRYETLPSTERTTPVERVEADMGPVSNSSTGYRNTGTDQSIEGHLDCPGAGRVGELHDCGDNIPQFSSVYYGIHEASSQASLPSLHGPQFAGCQLHNLPDRGVLLSDPATSCSNEVIGHVDNISDTLAMDTDDRFNPDCPSNFDDILCNSRTFDLGNLLSFPT
ncbi:hypothetical protein FNYG_02362 [Fusarium nygamai]|uniref:Uncharacterized protein n=1 Tax=Gibberella nygamai TaxID=42673 RepID=A0A2K0WPT1_GIBNY|nr:hypothetical protein FNYG_02362 [Fusarium nygamai]